MMNYEILPTNKKYYWGNILTYFSTLYAMQKAYPEDRSAESRLKSAANITHIAPEISIDHTSINSNRGDEIETLEDKSMTAYHNYVEGLEESLLGAKEYESNISKDQTRQTSIFAKLAGQLKQKDKSLEQIM